MAGGRGKAKAKAKRRRSPQPRPARPQPERARRPADPGETRPEAPWGSLPLAEILILAGIIFLVWGALSTRPVTIAVGLGLASLGGLELSIREHFGGYRSHTLLLAAVAGFATLAGCAYLTDLILGIALALAAIVFVAAFFGLRYAFRRASGGYNFRIGGFKG